MHEPEAHVPAMLHLVRHDRHRALDPAAGDRRFAWLFVPRPVGTARDVDLARREEMVVLAPGLFARVMDACRSCEASR
jgi:hypothetical protein